MKRLLPNGLGYLDNRKGNMGLGRNRAVQSAASRGSMTTMILLMLAFMASFYVAGRLWQDAELRGMLVDISEKNFGQGGAGLTVEDKLKSVEFKDLHKRVVDLEMEVIAARKQGFVTQNQTVTRTRPKAVLGINTSFGQRGRRDAIRKAWSSSGLKQVEQEKGMIIRFLIGRSANRGDSSDRLIDQEQREMQDFLILESAVEGTDEVPRKTKLYFKAAVEIWDAGTYWKAEDEFVINLEKLDELLTNILDKPRAYIGCMKSGEVVTDSKMRWYEPEWWKFGDGKMYHRHAAAPMYGLSRAVAQFVAINNDILHEYQNEDISVGAWVLGLDVDHIDERRLCCGAPPEGAICSTRN